MSAMTQVGPPDPAEYAAYYQPYLDLVDESDVLAGLEDQIQSFRQVIGKIPADQAEVCHPPYTWTPKQVVGHIIDNERIFGYRASRYAVGDVTPLPGYDQDHYAAATDYNLCTLDSLVDEFEHVRRSNLALLRRLPASAFDQVGIADSNRISVRAITYLLIGHLRHHEKILQSRIGE